MATIISNSSILAERDPCSWPCHAEEELQGRRLHVEDQIPTRIPIEGAERLLAMKTTNKNAKRS
jgi:hypothetical protein